MIDPITARWVIWGYKNTYHTHNHIHEALFRALKFMGRDVVWVDNGDPLMEFGDFRGCIFLTEHQKIADIFPGTKNLSISCTISKTVKWNFSPDFQRSIGAGKFESILCQSFVARRTSHPRK